MEHMISWWKQVVQNAVLHYSQLTQLNRLQEQIPTGLYEMAASCVFQRREKECEETNRLWCCCFSLSDIWEETLGGNHGTKQHHPPHNVRALHQQTFGLPSYKHQIEIENYGWLKGDLLGVAQDNGKEAILCCYNNHYNTDEQCLRPGKLGCISAQNRPKLRRNWTIAQTTERRRVDNL